MRKSDGTYTYFVPDVAYHVTKWQRGFRKVIDVQGTDHHSTMTRVRAGLQALGLGIPPDYPDYVLHSLVKVMRGGEEVKISKRAGSYVTVRDLIDWVGRDAVRFFLVSRKADSDFVFDVDLARAKSEENPVYYVQYAHARVCSVLAQWGGDPRQLARRRHDAARRRAHEMALLARLMEYPEVVEDAARDLAPHAVAFYLRELAAEFHSYYNATRLLVDDENVKLARLALACAVREVLRNGSRCWVCRRPRKCSCGVRPPCKARWGKITACRRTTRNPSASPRRARRQLAARRHPDRPRAGPVDRARRGVVHQQDAEPLSHARTPPAKPAPQPAAKSEAKAEDKSAKAAPDAQAALRFLQDTAGRGAGGRASRRKEAQKPSTAAAERETFFLQAGAFQNAPDADNLQGAARAARRRGDDPDRDPAGQGRVAPRARRALHERRGTEPHARDSEAERLRHHPHQGAGVGPAPTTMSEIR